MDELPQLINVLRGEMSLIGPRPCIPNEAREYLVWHRKRFDIHPGLTGLWQVSGKNRTTFRQMVSLDINYTKKRSFWLDFKILFKTIPAIIEQAKNRLL
jgi:lipopolysaccharide/colanic/teichoic acid biosynthesis glycosyltransferase